MAGAAGKREIIVLSLLPPSSFVAVPVTKLKEPEVVLNTSSMSDCDMAGQYAFCGKLEHEPAAAYSPTSKNVYAERYGGSGIGVNGGGARCGWAGGLTIKGIGPTLLAGRTAPYWHSYGGASLREAIRETIWGEVFNCALPYGASRVVGIIKTGTCVPLRYPDENGSTTSPRALILRPAMLRPAHFLPAALFDAKDGFYKQHPRDAVRTTQALQYFHPALCQSLGLPTTVPLEQLIALCVTRYARQISTARAKRLVHGSITPSNITLAGEYLDFGMSSALSDHGRIIVARACPDSWEQHAPLSRSIDDLIFCLRKCGAFAHHSADSIALNIRNLFTSELDSQFRIELLKLSGVVGDDIRRLPPSIQHAASSVFIELITAGNSDPRKLLSPCPNYRPFMPDTIGRYHLGRCIVAVSENSSRDASSDQLEKLIPDLDLRMRFCHAYWNLRDADTRQYSCHETRRFMLGFTARRLNAPIPALYSFELNRQIDAVIRNGQSVVDFIGRTMDRCLLSLTQELETPFHWVSRELGELRVGGQNGVVLNGHAIQLRDAAKFYAQLGIDGNG
jgi:hypothetical protein